MPGKLNFTRWIKYKYLLFIRIKDYPGSIATGAALGISFDILPTFGLGVIFAYLLATVLRVNRLAALLAAVVFKLAIPIFIYMNVQMGQIFIKDNRPIPVEIVADPKVIFNWSYLGTSFLLGSAINALIAFVITFVIVYRFISWRRSRRSNMDRRL